MWDEVKADKETVMNLYEMSCPALTQSQVACNRIMNYFHPFYFFLTITLGHPKLLNLHLCQLQSVVFVICQTSNSTSSDMLEAKCAQIWLEVFSGEYPMKILLSGFLLSSSSSDCWHVFFLFFFDGSGPDITESSHVSLAQPQKAPADHSSRQGGVGHRGEELSESCRVWRTKELVYSSAPHRHPSQLSTGSIRAGNTHFKQAPCEQSSSGSNLQKV